MLGATLIGFFVGGKSLGMVASTAYSSIDVFTFLAVPGFIYAGDLMLHGRIAEVILNEVNKLGGKIKSILGSFAVILSMLFGTILGSSTATVGLVGGMLIPKMTVHGYKKEESAALISAAGILGILIPPSIPGIMYATTAGQSIIDVWLSTITSALLLGPLFILVNVLRCRNKLIVHETDTAFIQSNQSKKFNIKSIPALLAPIIIFAGIFGGVFTPTEAAAVIVFYSLLVGYFVYKGLNRKNLFDITLTGAKNTAAIIILISFASVAGRLFTITSLPKILVNVIAGLNMSKITILLLINGILIIVGMFMETNTSILILTPLLLPMAEYYHLSPLHFGAMMLLNLQLGMLTPPFAANIFVACKVANVPFNKIISPLIWYWIVIIPVLFVVTFVPQFSTIIIQLTRGH
jgi:C4-dicarboxylate transporter DctM subunit